MKITQNKHILLLFFFIVSILYSCKKQDLPAKPQPSPFSAIIEGNNSNFSAAGGTTNIIVTAGEDGWWLSVPVTNWCVITKIYGSGDFKIPVTIKQNTTGADRSIQIQVNPTFNLPPVIITLNQSK